jgi:Rhodopirellula transposase DDE domain
VIATIEELMQHDVAGDPITGARWTRRTTDKISAQLRSLDIHVGPRTVARLLKQLDYRLRVNHKRVSRGSGPDRNEQFEYIAEQRTRFAGLDLPIVSIDSKKRELVGNFKNPGTAWRRTPDLVNDHDFRSEAEGIAIPYGVYDLRANRGTVFVGTSHDTPDFAVDNLIRWWQLEGLQRYTAASELLVLADSGGSSNPRAHAFHYALQTRLADPLGISVTVCHYPSGASKWNPIEHRLFSEISKNWAGHPLRSYDTILHHLQTTKTKTGLRVSAHLVDQDYPRGVKIAPADFATMALAPHEIQPRLNYTIRPRS